MNIPKEYQVEVYIKGCPLCSNDVRGNDLLLFHCKRCNLLFRREQIAKHLGKPPKVETIKANFVGSTGSNKFHQRNCPFVKKILKENVVYFETVDEARKYGYLPCFCVKGIGSKGAFVGSALSGKFHLPNCPFVKKIKHGSIIHFKTIHQAEQYGYEQCDCIKKSNVRK